MYVMLEEVESELRGEKRKLHQRDISTKNNIHIITNVPTRPHLYTTYANLIYTL